MEVVSNLSVENYFKPDRIRIFRSVTITTTITSIFVALGLESPNFGRKELSFA
jgi:hypothetical protein